MALYVIPVPAPAAGHDWRYTVPGQYIEHITAITATLTTQGADPTVLHDVSGNGNDGDYNYTAGIHPLGAGFFPGANAAHWYRQPLPPQQSMGEAFVGVDIGITYSFDVWLLGDNTAANGMWPFWAPNISAGPGSDFSVSNTGVMTFRYVGSGGLYTAFTAAVFPFDGQAHHIGYSWDSTHCIPYLDGVAQATTESGTPTTDPAFFNGFQLGESSDASSPRQNGHYGQPAFYQSVLSAGRFAAHAAANGSLTAYSAAVMADSPIQYYDLNDSAGGGGRQALLDITDGTHKVIEVPSGFADVATGATFTYSWQANLNSSTQTPTGGLTTIAIPDLILPAGYTIGTRTLDLGATDQWSAINIWWDDTYQTIVTGLGDYHYPPGAYYVYEQVGV